MPVFKAYFKVLRVALPGMLIYLIIYLAMSIIFSMFSGPVLGEFQQTRTPIAIINRDGDTPITEGLTAYLREANTLKDFPDDPEKLQDALFFRDVEYIVIIPVGFSEGFMVRDEVALQRIAVPDSTSSYYVDLQIDKYLNTLRLHQQFGNYASWDEVHQAVEADLQQAVPVSIPATTATQVPGYVYYFSYLAFILLALIMLGISTIMLAFNKREVQMRNLCTPLPVRRMNLQLAAGHALLALGCWAVVVIFAVIFYGFDLIVSDVFWLLCLNSLVFAAVCTSIGLLVGSLIKNHNAQGGAVNIVTLGMCFVSGVFVPQAFLSPMVLTFSKFLPTFWYVRAHEAIGSLLDQAGANLATIYAPMLIQLGFAVAIFSVTLLLSKERQASVS